MKNEPVLSVLARLVRDGPSPEDGDFERDLYQLYKLAPEKYIGMLVQEERDQLDEKQKRQIVELKKELREEREKREFLEKRALELVDELQKLESVGESAGKVMALLERLMEEPDDTQRTVGQPQEALQVDRGGDDE